MFNIFGENNQLSYVVRTKNGQTTINANGKTVTVSGKNVSIINGKIFVDGKEHTVEGKTIDIDTVIVEGNCNKLECISAEIRGDAKGDVECTSLICGGDIHGNVDSTNIKCRDIKGSVDSLNVTCESMAQFDKPASPAGAYSEVVVESNSKQRNSKGKSPLPWN